MTPEELYEHRDTWTCPRCGAVHYLADGDASDQHCGCDEE